MKRASWDALRGGSGDAPARAQALRTLLGLELTGRGAEGGRWALCAGTRDATLERWLRAPRQARWVVRAGGEGLALEAFADQPEAPLWLSPWSSPEPPGLGFLQPEGAPPAEDPRAPSARALRRLSEAYVSALAAGEAPEVARARLLGEALRGLEGQAPEWARVRPEVLGAAYQAFLEPSRRHGQGAHFTPTALVERVVRAALHEPLEARLAAASQEAEFAAFQRRLTRTRVLDPACGSGDFLAGALRSLCALERALERRRGGLQGLPRVSLSQLHGIDRDPEVLRLAGQSLALWARRLGCPEPGEPVLSHADALFAPWPRVEAIVGNPPFLAMNKAQAALGPAYLARLRVRFPAAPGRADLCAHFFPLAHAALEEGGRAGLIATTAIRHTSSRQASLEPVLAAGGALVEVVSSQAWPGAAGVCVCLATWQKGGDLPHTRLWQEQLGASPDSPWSPLRRVSRIGADLRPDALDLNAATRLRANTTPKRYYQGQTPGHAAFLLPAAEAEALRAAHPPLQQVLLPFADTEDLLRAPHFVPRRYVIDFGERSLDEAKTLAPELVARLEATVLPTREARAHAEAERNRAALAAGERPRNAHHAGFLKRWWLLSWRRPSLVRALQGLPRYLATPRISSAPCWVFLSPEVRPMDLLYAFPVADDYAFGVLHSSAFDAWRRARGGALTRTPRTTPTRGFASFPWPQSPSPEAIAQVRACARELQAIRDGRAQALGSLRAAYAESEGPLPAAQAALDASLCAAYGRSAAEDLLPVLLELNRSLAEAEERGRAVRGAFDTEPLE